MFVDEEHDARPRLQRRLGEVVVVVVGVVVVVLLLAAAAADTEISETERGAVCLSVC